MDSIASLFLDDAVDKQIKIEYDDGTITNKELHFEEIELVERLCSESQLRFGACESAMIKFRISNEGISLKDKWLAVTDTLEDDITRLFALGNYKVDSDKPTADRRYRDIIAYDAMYDIINAEVSKWYNELLPNADSTITLKEFRDSFLAYFGIEQEEVELINDSMTVSKTIEPSKLSGKTVITAICEINGCFGHIGRDGKFKYVFLRDLDLYPADTLYPAEDVYPGIPGDAEEISKSHYISAKYEDYETAVIDKLQIRQEEDDIGYIFGDGSNCYVVQDNFLVYGKGADELQVIAENLYAIISNVWYRPAHVEAKGNPCLEVGDGIKLETSRGTIYTYILQRTLKGIQALRDTYDAEGEQCQTQNPNSVRESIIQLKGKTNKLTRTLDETKSEIVDMENNLSSQIKQNAEQILLRVKKDNIISEINQTAEKITISALKIDLVGLVESKEFISKYATIENLNATNLVVEEKLDAKDFTAEKISAMEISVQSANVLGTFSGYKISAGEIVSTNYTDGDSAYTCGSGMKIDLDIGNIWWANGSIRADTAFMHSIGYEVPTRNGGYNLNFKGAMGVHGADEDVMIIGYGYSSVMLPSGATVTSIAEKKENIIPCSNALSAVENTDVYYFNYKNDTIKRNKSQKVGFIIGEGYNLDPRLLSETGDAIDTYNAIALVWRATQQLYAKVKKQQDQIKEMSTLLADQEV